MNKKNRLLFLRYHINKKSKEFNKAADNLFELGSNLEKLRRSIKDPIKRGSIFATYPHFHQQLAEMLYEANRDEELFLIIEAAKNKFLADIADSSLDSSDEILRWDIESIKACTQRFNFHYLSYLCDQDYTYVVLLTKAGQILKHKIPISRDQIRKVLGFQFNQPQKAKSILPEKKFREYWSLLNQMIDWVAPYLQEGLLKGAEHICYSLDDELNLFPLHCFYLSDRPLIESFSVSRTLSFSHIRSLIAKKSNRPKEFKIFQTLAEEDLVKTKENFEAISSKLEQYLNGQTYQEIDATVEKVFNSSLSQNNLLHFSCHGTFGFPGKLPFFPYIHSGLLLYNKELRSLKMDTEWFSEPKNIELLEKVLLTPKKIFIQKKESNFGFNNAHVSLMACVSGNSKEGIGGDAVGLELGLFYAGAGSTMTTHWNVDVTAASLFFQKFYENWIFSNMSKAQAHRNATLYLIDKCKNQFEKFSDIAVYVWGAFSLSGDWR